MRMRLYEGLPSSKHWSVRINSKYRISQPAFGARDPCCFYAVVGAQFADGLGKVVADRSLGESKVSGDIAARHPFACETQYLTLTIGKRVGFGPGFGGQFWIDDPQSLLHAAHGLSQFLGAHVLEQIS